MQNIACEPMNRCDTPASATTSLMLQEEAEYGYCACKEESYYGFKRNLLINSEGVITEITTKAANIDERDSLWDLLPGITGRIIADKGLIGADYKEELRQLAQIDLQTAVRCNMQENRSESSRRSLAAPTAHTTVHAMSHTAVSVKCLTKSFTAQPEQPDFFKPGFIHAMMRRYALG